MSTYATILCLLLTVPAYAVDTLTVTTPDPMTEAWRWTEFDRRSGIAGNIYDAFEDRDGNIWFATEHGAQKYDGLRWTTYTTEDGLPNAWVEAISETRDGAMWFLTSSRGSNAALSAGVTRLVEAEGEAIGDVSTHFFEGWFGANGFLEAADGSIWLHLAKSIAAVGTDLVAEQVTDVQDLRRYVNGRWETVDQPERTSRGIVQDRNGAIWFGCRGGVLRFDGVRWTRFEALLHGSPEVDFSFATGRHGTIFADSGMPSAVIRLMTLTAINASVL